MKILGHYFDSSVFDHRLSKPFKYLSRDLPDHTFTLSTNCHREGFDWLCLGGRCKPEALPLIAQLKSRGTKFAWHTDDDLTSVPTWNRYRPATDYERDLYYVIRDCADFILCSTPHLETIVNRPHKTTTAPNLTDLAQFTSTSTPAPLAPGEPVRVLWSGSDTHVKDCELIVPAVKAMLKKYGNGVEFFFLGYCPDELLRDYLSDRVHYNEWIDLCLYSATLCKVRPHVCLAPMHDDQFNRCKSNIRIQESGALSAAVLASPVGEYQCVESGIDGETAVTEEEWVTKLDRLITDHEYRTHLATVGRRRCEREWDWNRVECREPWREWVRRLEAVR